MHYLFQQTNGVGNTLPNGKLQNNDFSSEVLVAFWQRNWRDYGFFYVCITLPKPIKLDKNKIEPLDNHEI